MSILTKLVNTFNDTRCIFNQANKVHNIRILGTNAGKHRGIPVVISDEQLFLSARTPKRYPGAISFYRPVLGTVIVVNESFYDLPEEHQKAILDHEVGHCVLHKLKDLPEGYHNQQWELEADAYSVANGNDMRAALMYLRDIYTSAYGIIGDKTLRGLDERIEALS